MKSSSFISGPGTHIHTYWSATSWVNYVPIQPKLVCVSAAPLSTAFGKGVKLVLLILHYLQMTRVKSPFCSTVLSDMIYIIIEW